jgi:hypothetical protein
MRKLAFALVVLSLSIAGSAFATCPTPPTAYNFFPPFTNYTQDGDCYSLTGYISSTSVACYTGAGWSFGGPGLSYAVTSFTADGNYIFNANNWSGGSYIYFDSPNASAYDWIELIAVVTHNGYDTRYSLFYWDGTMGSLNGCNDHYGLFSAVGGDTVAIKVYVGNSGNANIQASIPRIFNTL